MWRSRDQTFKMGAGEKVASDNREVKYEDQCDFSSTPLKHGPTNKQWLAETKKNFSGTDLILVIVSLITYVLDTVTDILVGIKYMEDGEYLFGSLALGCVVVASVVIQLFSSRWYSRDGKATGCRHWFIHVFLLQPIERYLLVLVAGMQAHYNKTTDNIDNYFYQQNDLCILRLFEAFLESAPQLTLQLYVIMCTQTAGWLTATSACVSLVAIGWAVVAYSHALRHAYCVDYHVYWPGLMLQTVWHVSIVASRVIAIVAFTATFSVWILLCLAGHWTLMTIWVTLQKTDFGTSRCERALFVSVVGTIYCFSFFNLKEGSTRWRALAFYSLMLVENGCLVAVWYCYRVPGAWYDDSVVPVVSTTFLIGVCCMLIYYRFCHPHGPIYWQRKKAARREPVKYCDQSAATDQPRPMTTQRSAGRLSRRSLLKQPSEALLDVEFREVATPSHLSPIRGHVDDSYDERNVYTDCSLDLDTVSNYQHYSVDASAYMSRCPSLATTGIDLSPTLTTTSGSSLPPGSSTSRVTSDESASATSTSRCNTKYDLQDLFRDIMVYTRTDRHVSSGDGFVSPSPSIVHGKVTPKGREMGAGDGLVSDSSSCF